MSKDRKNPDWKRMSFKGNKVWVQTDKAGNLAVENNKVLIKYNLKQDYEYRVHPESLKPENQAVPAKTHKKGSTKQSTQKKKIESSNKKNLLVSNPDDNGLPDNCIKIYTDGASSGNPGPAGIGVLFIFEDKQREISRYIGHGTNNIAELSAIKTALEELKRDDLPVRIYTDSNYSIGLLTQGWKPKKNQSLIHQIKGLMARFSDLKFIKVKGHAGIKENEVADYLATSAIKKGLK